MNANLFHNILNLVALLVGALIGFDWVGLGFSPQTAAQIAGAILFANGALKLGVNVSRDGLGGLVLPQPPVKK